MTDSSKTEIAIILDRSGSMRAIRDDMVGGYQTFLEEQKRLPGKLNISLYQFDDDFEVVYEGQPAAKVEPLELVPRGRTALLDAVGKAVVALGERLRKQPEPERPGAVIVLVITDGEENASKEYDAPTIQKLIAQQEQQYNWKFLYLGADAKGFADAKNQGFQRAARFKNDARGVSNMYATSSRSILNYRDLVSRNVPDADIDLDSSQ